MGFFATTAYARPHVTPETVRPEPQVSVTGSRNYSPSLGRWISRDPAEESGGLSAYRFLANDPVVYVDAFGLTPCRFVTPGANGDWVELVPSGGGYSVDSLGVGLTTGSANSEEETTGSARVEKANATKNWLGLLKCVDVRVYVTIPQKAKKLSQMQFPVLPYDANQGFGNAFRASIDFHVGYAPHAPLGREDSAIAGGFYEVLLAHEKGHMKPYLDHLSELRASIEALPWYATEQEVENAVSTFNSKYFEDSNKGANEFTIKYMDAQATFKRVKRGKLLIKFPDIDKGYVYEFFWKKE